MQSTSQDSSVMNDRLKKAIERNRARQVKREQIKTKVYDEPQGLFNNSGLSGQAKVLKPGATRTGVARADTLQFTSKIESRANRFSNNNISYKSNIKPTIKRKPKKISTFKNFSFSGASKTSKKKKSLLILKVCWAMCLVLVVRLIFTEGGIWDYQKQNVKIAQIKKEIKEIKIENSNLVTELKLIKTSKSYRKELVRKHLGFISSDEYLVLFAENNLNKEI